MPSYNRSGYGSSSGPPQNHQTEANRFTPNSRVVEDARKLASLHTSLIPPFSIPRTRCTPEELTKAKDAAVGAAWYLCDKVKVCGKEGLSQGVPTQYKFKPEGLLNLDAFNRMVASTRQ
jgi:hypothetical protein